MSKLRKMFAFASSAALAAGTVTAGIVTVGSAMTPTVAQAQDKTEYFTWPTLLKDVEANIANQPGTCTSYLAVERNRKFFHVVGKIKDANKETDFLVPGEKVSCWFLNPRGEASQVSASGLGYKKDGQLADYKIDKVMPNAANADGKGIGSGRVDLFVAPRKVSPVVLFSVREEKPKQSHPSQRFGVPIRENMPQ